MWNDLPTGYRVNAYVRRGDKGSWIVYANTITKMEANDAGEEIEREIPFLKSYTVFNAEQIDGLPDRYYSRPEPTLTPVERIARAEEFFAATGADIRSAEGAPCMRGSPTTSNCHLIEAFRDAESFYATLAHEAAHWTKHR